MSLAQTASREPSAGSSAAAAASTAYDNNGQYSRSGILRYEMIFGAGYVSTGGPDTTLNLCSRLGTSLRPGVRVLDVGSGIGGAAFHLAKTYGARVTGIDLAPEMVAIAHERASEADAPQGVDFILGDILTTEFPEKFDIVWSRDALMHLHDKHRLFTRLHSLMAPGGKLVLTDYARGTGEGSPAFQAYVQSTGYHLVDPATYGRLLEAAGFVDVAVDDATEKFIGIMKHEAERLGADRARFLGAFSEPDLDYLLARWAMKDGFCRAGDMKWGIYLASRRG
jgi:phosphoethanolamine N-methyltransferase